MVDIGKLENDARQHASKAVELDKHSKFEDAAFFYDEAAQALISVHEQLVSKPDPTRNISSLGINEIIRLIKQYKQRAEEIKANLKSKPAASLHLKNTEEKGIDRARYLLTQALDHDEQKQYEAAFQFYQDAAALCLHEKKSSTDPKLKEQLDKLALEGRLTLKE